MVVKRNLLLLLHTKELSHRLGDLVGKWLTNSTPTSDIGGSNPGTDPMSENWSLFINAWQFIMQNLDRLVCIGFLYP